MITIRSFTRSLTRSFIIRIGRCKMITFYFTRKSRIARRLAQAALALILCSTMILSTVAPALADDGGETPPPA
jgi:hypothetical protein